MRLLELYTLKRVAVMFFGVLAATVGIAWTVQVLGRIDFLTTSGQSFGSILKFSAMLLPSAFPLVMPFALVIAITQTLSTMNQDSELVVINAAGGSRSIVLRPILMFAVAVSIASFLIANFVDPYARLNMRTMIAEARADLLNVIVQEGTFQEIDKNLYIQIAERKPNGHIGGLFVSDSRDPTIDLIYYAKDGVIAQSGNTSLLMMGEGEVQRREVKSGSVSIIKFNSYAFDLSEFMSASDEIVLFAKDQPLSTLLNPDEDDPIYQRSPRKYRAELHRRLTEWVYPFVFALISLAVVADPRSHREARISAGFTAISLCIIVFWLGFLSGQQADNSDTFIPLMYIVPIVSCGFAIFMMTGNRRINLPNPWMDRLADIANRISGKDGGGPSWPFGKRARSGS